MLHFLLSHFKSCLRKTFGIYITTFLCNYFRHNDLNEAQWQPAFEKTTVAIHWRLDFVVMSLFLVVLFSQVMPSGGHWKKLFSGCIRRLLF